MPQIRKSPKSALLALALVAFALMGVAFAGQASSRMRLFDREQLQITSGGTCVIDSATSTFTSFAPLITITPDASNTNALGDVRILLYLDQTTTGFSAVYTSDTAQFAIARKVDGTNWAFCSNLATTALSGTNAAKSYIELTAGNVGPTESLAVYAKVSTQAHPVANIPFVVYYRAPAAATIAGAQ